MVSFTGVNLQGCDINCLLASIKHQD
jgi:hypothetical protein